MIKRRQIFIASIGTSPGVLTNAVWARDWRVRFCSYGRVMGKRGKEHGNWQGADSSRAARNW